MVEGGAFTHKIDYVTRASKSHYWFKSYGNFAESVDFVYWWSFSGEGFAINGATPSSLYSTTLLFSPDITSFLKSIYDSVV